MQAAIDLQVDFVTIAGDVFDQGSPAVSARVAFRNGVQSLHEAGIPVFLALGNHDPLCDFSELLRSMPGLQVFGASPEMKLFSSASFAATVGVHGISFPKSAVRENLVTRFRHDPRADFAIGVVHANVSGVPGHDDYAPCSLDDLRGAGMNVWCLGHVHNWLVLSADPLIIYPGTLQGAHVNETGPHGCALVTVDESGHTVHEFLQIAPMRWEQRDVDVSEVGSAEDVLDAMEQECRGMAAAQDGLDAYIVRLNLTGRTGSWMTDFRELNSDALDIVSQRLTNLPVPVFAASVRDLTRPSIDTNALLNEGGFLPEFLAVCRDAAAEPDLARALLHTVEAELSKMRLRRFVEAELGIQRRTVNPAALADLLREVEDTVVKLFFNAVETQR